MLMMVKGHVINNTGRSRHIFKRTVYPGQKVTLKEVYGVLGAKVPASKSFVDWLEDYLPPGWELSVEAPPAPVEKKEYLDAVPVVTDGKPAEDMSKAVGAYKEDNEGPKKETPTVSMQYATPRAIGKMTARDIYNLQLKDNPKRVLKHVNSIHKLRRALTLCKNDNRKQVLTRLIQGRIRELNVTL